MINFSFNFRGKDSYLDYGILIEKRPSIPLAQRNITYEKIAGKNGALTIDDGTYDNITIQIECNFIDDNFVNKADSIKAWLMGPPDRLIFSDNNNMYYEAQVVNRVDIANVIAMLGQFTIVFNCSPFKRLLQDYIEIKYLDVSITRQSITINPLYNYNFIGFGDFQLKSESKLSLSQLSFYNLGIIESQPKLKLFGIGDISITLNYTTFIIKDLKDWVIVDSEMMDAYRETELWNNKMIGDFPTLAPGENKFEWTGNLTSIELNPNTLF